MITQSDKIIQERLYDLNEEVVDVMQSNNQILESYFVNLNFLSDLLPTYLNQLTVLSDKITDVLTLSGNTRLSTGIQALPVVTSKGIDYNSTDGTIALSAINELNYQINSQTSSIISQSNN